MKPAYLLAGVPIAAFLIGPYFVNRTLPLVLGMPLLLAWIAGGVVATSVVMGCIYYLDGGPARDADDERDGGRP